MQTWGVAPGWDIVAPLALRAVSMLEQVMLNSATSEWRLRTRNLREMRPKVVGRFWPGLTWPWQNVLVCNGIGNGTGLRVDVTE
jgi:hypothetical protein